VKLPVLPEITGILAVKSRAHARPSLKVFLNERA